MELAILGLLLAAGAVAMYKIRSSQVDIPDEPPPPLVVPGGRVVVIGDSIAIGLRRQFMANAIREKVSVNYQSKGGTTTSEWLDKLPDMAMADAFVVVLGTNDAAGNGKSFGDAMRRILEHGRKGGVPVVWVQPTGDHFKAYDGIMGQIQAALDERDIYLMVPRPVDGYASDNVHMGPEGYARWADRVWNALIGGEYAATAVN
jgi:lysophospholipase L1-like esterase